MPKRGRRLLYPFISPHLRRLSGCFFTTNYGEGLETREMQVTDAAAELVQSWAEDQNLVNKVGVTSQCGPKPLALSKKDSMDEEQEVIRNQPFYVGIPEFLGVGGFVMDDA